MGVGGPYLVVAVLLRARRRRARGMELAEHQRFTIDTGCTTSDELAARPLAGFPEARAGRRDPERAVNLEP